MKKLIIGLVVVLLSVSAQAELPLKAYVPFVKPMEQRPMIKHPKRFEGCGPVAMAMLGGWWAREKGYKRIMSHLDAYNGNTHPTNTIENFYAIADARKSDKKGKFSDGKYYFLSSTLRKDMYRAFENTVVMVNGSNPELPKLRAEKMRRVRLWKTRRHSLKNSLAKGRPVIAMLTNLPKCLSYDNKFEKGRHYVVMVGYDETTKNFQLINGWAEMPYWTSLAASVHKRSGQVNFDGTHVNCTYGEIKNANPSLIWLRQKK